MSVCINCGHIKKRPIDECTVCQFQPRSPEEKAKSVILSTYYDIDDQCLGKTPEELRAIASQVAAGEYRFDPREVEAVARYGESVASITTRRLVIDLIKWVGPPLFLLLAFLTIIWLAR